MGKPYSEDKELTRYIWDYCTDFMTDFEREVGNSVVLSETINESLIKKWIFIKTQEGSKDASDIPEVKEALKDGQMAFRETVMHRIMKENRNTININRCSKCNCVVKTPKARLCLWCGHICLWCGHSWYDEQC